MTPIAINADLSARYDRLKAAAAKYVYHEQKNAVQPNKTDRDAKNKYARLVKSILAEDGIALKSIQGKIL